MIASKSSLADRAIAEARQLVAAQAEALASPDAALRARAEAFFASPLANGRWVASELVKTSRRAEA